VLDTCTSDLFRGEALAFRERHMARASFIFLSAGLCWANLLLSACVKPLSPAPLVQQPVHTRQTTAKLKTRPVPDTELAQNQRTAHVNCDLENLSEAQKARLFQQFLIWEQRKQAATNAAP
jgi:hypothetical protein